jgi:hypothetical protein
VRAITWALATVAMAAPPAADRDADWRADLEYFAGEFAARRIDFRKSYPSFAREMTALEAEAARLTDAEIVLRLMRIVAGGNDAHTSVSLPVWRLGFRQLPFSTHWYADGLFVVAAAPGFDAALGARVVKIGRMTAEEALQAVAPYISHENDAGLREFSSAYLQTVEILQAAGVAETDGTAILTLERPGGSPFVLRARPQPSGVVNAIRFPPTLSNRNREAFYWHEYLPAARALYVQYNRRLNDPKIPFDAFARVVFGVMDSRPVERVVVDLRFNPGGNSRVIQPLKEGLLSRRKPVYVLIGPGTFSSAMDNAIEMRRQLKAVLIGEGTGERPNDYGEVKRMTLPHSALEIQYSTKYFRRLKDTDPPALEPDVLARGSFADAAAGRDRALEEALRRGGGR